VANGRLDWASRRVEYGFDSVALSPDGRALATAGRDSMVRVWNAKAGKEIRTLAAHAGPVRDVAFTSNGKILASRGTDGSIKLWDTASGKALRSIRADHGSELSGRARQTIAVDGKVRKRKTLAKKRLEKVERRETTIVSCHESVTL
jgi:WD40 repeat protein